MLTWTRELFERRELLYFLTLREVKARYKQTVLGAAWAVLQPFALMVTMTVVFSLFARLPSDGVPYALFAYAALLPWTFLTTVLGRSAGIILTNQTLVKKVYFPREILVFSTILAALLDLAIGSALFFGLLWWFRVPLTLSAFLALPVIIVQLCLLLGLVLILSPLNVFYRDVSHIIPLLVQIWMFVSPVVYPIALVPQRLRPVYLLNPMAGILDAYRRTLLHGRPPDVATFAPAVLIAVGVLGIGAVYFRRVEYRLADVL